MDSRPNYTDLVRNDPSQKIKLEDINFKKDASIKHEFKVPKFQTFHENIDRKKRKKPKSDEKSQKKSNFEELIEEENRVKAQKELNKRLKTEEPWMDNNIIVKIITKAYGEKCYKTKGEVIDVLHQFKAVIKLLNDDKTSLTVDQNDCETVIPNVGRKVKILAGKYKGHLSTLQSLEVEKFRANLMLCDSNESCSLPYEYFSKCILKE